MKKLSYAEKLRRPEWQKKRLEILNRDGFACTSCGDTESELHVHHGYYEKGVEPWEYPDESLRTLCGDCHVVFEQIRKDVLSRSASLSWHHWNILALLATAIAGWTRDEAKSVRTCLELAGIGSIEDGLVTIANTARRVARRNGGEQ